MSILYGLKQLTFLSKTFILYNEQRFVAENANNLNYPNKCIALWSTGT